MSAGWKPWVTRAFDYGLITCLIGGLLSLLLALWIAVGSDPSDVLFYVAFGLTLGGLASFGIAGFIQPLLLGDDPDGEVAPDDAAGDDDEWVTTP